MSIINKGEKIISIRTQTLKKRIKSFNVGHPGDHQLLIEVYPKRKKNERHVADDIDIVRLTLTEADGKRSRILEMTPDEALELAQSLTTAAWGFLVNYKPYWDTFMKRKRALTKLLTKKYGTIQSENKKSGRA